MNTPSRVTIPRFPDGKRIAVTFSFDDGHTHDRRIVEAFNQWGLKGTFNLNSGKLGRAGRPTPDGPRAYLDASEIAELFRGHEVAIHTVTHPSLHLLDPSQIALEVLEDRRALEDLVGYPVRGMAYPFGAYDERVIGILKSLGVVYSRTTKNAAPCFPAEEPLAWATTAHQYASEPSVVERFEQLYANERYSDVFFVWGHGFEFHDRDDWAGLERICKPLSGREGVWYCTNIELFDYEAARRALVIAANKKTAFNPSALPVTVDVDGRLLEIPGGKVVSLTEA